MDASVVEPLMRFRHSRLCSLLGFLSVVPCSASTCSPKAWGPACEKLATLDVVFVGTVLAAEPGLKLPHRDVSIPFYRFRVERVYKGLPHDVGTVIIDPGGVTKPPAEYILGQKYIVYANRHGAENLVSDACLGSTLFDKSGEDVAFLEAYRLGLTKNAVLGRAVQRYEALGRLNPETDAPVAGALVVLSNESLRLTERTTKAGEFRFEAIPPGTYSVSARLDPYIPTPHSYEIDVPAAGCVEVFPTLEAGASISGTLVDESGNPAAGKRVELQRRSPSGKWYAVDQYWSETDPRGEFRFDRLQEGDYRLGYEIQGTTPLSHLPYPATYYPGVADPETAAVLHLLPRQDVTDVRIVLQKAHTPRIIRIEVVWADGTPSTGEQLDLLNGYGHIRAEGSRVLLVEGYAEFEYNLSARYRIDDGGPAPYNQRRVARSGSVRVLPGKEPAYVQLVLTQTSLVDEGR